LKPPWTILLLALAGIVIFLALPRGEKSSSRPSPEARSPVKSSQAPTALSDHGAVPPGGIPEITEPGRAQPAEVSVSGVAVFPGSRERLSTFNRPEEPPALDLEIIEETFATYRQIFGQNPTGGTNAEITAALTGKNEKDLAIVPPDFATINSEGEIIDRWGTPYFFHPVSGQVMEVLSAGPDGLLWTVDDVGSITPAGRETQVE